MPFFRSGKYFSSRRGSRASALLALIALSAPAMAVDPERSPSQYAHRQWKTEAGLPQNTVRAIAQGADGALWLGTHAGLVRFDGVAFEVEHPDHPAEWGQFHTYALTSDDEGRLWVGTTGGGLFVRQPSGEIVPFEHSDDLPSDDIGSLAVDGESLWIGTEDNGVYRATAEGIESFGPYPDATVGAIHGLAPDGRGGCWVATVRNGLFHVRSGSLEVHGLEQGLPSEVVWDVLIDRQGHLWVGTNNGLARRRSSRPSAADQIGSSPGAPAPSEVATIESERWETLGSTQDQPLRARTLLQDRDGNIWVGTLGRGLFRLREGRLQPMPVQGRISNEVIWSLFEDREGHLWYGSLGGGLHQIFDSPTIPLGVAEGLAEQRPLAVRLTPDGALWIATRSSGVQRLTATGSRAFGTAEGLSSLGGWSLDFDSQGRLWVATLAPAVDRITFANAPAGEASWRDAEVAEVRSFTSTDGLGRGRILSVMVDRRDRTWVGTSGGLGKIEGEQVTTYTTDDGLANNLVLQTAEAPDGEIWVGTNNGLSIWDGQGFESLGRSHGMRNPRVWAILPETHRSGWVGTFGGGLHRIEDGRITATLTAADGLPSNDITELLGDELGYLWIGTTAGLARAPQGQLEAYAAGRWAQVAFRTFDARDGLRSAELYGGTPIGQRAPDGTLWFTTLDGLARFDPAQLVALPPPRTVVRGVWIDGVRNEVPADASAVEIAADHGTVEVRFTATTLRSPSRIHFRYRLSGLDGAWRRGADGLRAFELGRLPPGRYRLEIEASDELGDFVGAPTGVPLWVKPRLTQTRWFYALVALTLIGTGFATQQLQVRRLRRHQEELRKVASEAVASVRTLRGLLPICASCKKVRDDDGYWQQIEGYLDTHSEARLSHGLCPHCMDSYLEEVEELTDHASG